MKVVHMTSVHPPFDVRIFTRECAALAEAGYHTVEIAPHDGDCEQNGVMVRGIGVTSGGRLRRVLQRPFNVYRKTLSEDADVYHLHDPELLPVGLALRARGKLVVYDSHENLPRDIMHKPWIPNVLHRPVAVVAEVVEHAMAARMSAIVTADDQTAGRFKRFHQDVTVVRNYPRGDEFGAMAEDARRFESKTIVNFAGVNQDRVVREVVAAMGLVGERHDVRLLLGGGCDSAALLADLQGQPGWKDVEYVGMAARPKMLEMMRTSAAAMVLYARAPNNMDVRSNRLFEAMAAGLPVIVPDFPNWRAVVEAKCGLCVDPGNPHEIAAACEFMVSHPAEAAAMGRAGREMFLREFNWESEKGKLLDLYERLRDRRSGATVRTASFAAE